MSLRDRNAWIEQAKERVLANANATDSYVEELMYLYDECANQLELEINAIFAKYAKNNVLSEAEAARLLTGEEYSKWRKSIDRYITDAKTDSKTLLELNTLAAKSRISRKEQLLANVYQNMITLSGECEKKVTDLMGDMLKTNYYRNCYQIQSNMRIGFPVAQINPTLLKQVLEYPWSGKNFSQSLWENTDKLAAFAKREITLGFISGSSVQNMAKELNDVMAKGRYAAERLVRTESSYFANQGQIMAYQEAGIQEYEFLGGGCEECQALNGQHFSIREAEAGLNLPPIHPNCKCTTTAYFRQGMFPEKEGAASLEPGITYEGWKKKYVDSTEKENIIKLSDAEQYALNQYIGSGSYTLNEKLRSGGQLSGQEEKWMKDLDSALDKMTEYQGTVYRSVSDFGIEDVKKFLHSYAAGQVVSSPAYTSSAAKVYDEDFPIQYVITSKHGKDIRAYNRNEQEVLFKRNTRFYVTKVKGHTIYLEEK